jgi:glyoxylase-like metal-dependent hydrolase (beta-lactamase superfamily II)
MLKQFLLSAAILGLSGTGALAQGNDKLTTEDFGNGIYMLVGAGGNVGVLTGEDGTFVIDDKYDRVSDQIISIVKGLTDKPITYVINTHYHGDHTGSNTSLKAVGATVIAHDNVRVRMGQDIENKLWGRTVKAVPESQWPTITFSDDMTFHINAQTAKVVHVPNAHTDGDSIIYFEEANILHMGDNYFNGMFPYVDIDAGGSLQGMIAAHDTALAMINDETRIMPGHGPEASKADLMTAHEMLVDIQNRVQSHIDNGKSLEEILDAKILKDLGDYASFIDEDRMIRIAHRSLTNS